MKYQAILFDLDGTLLPMHEPTFVACFYQALVEYVTPIGASCKQVGELLKGSLAHVICNDGQVTNREAFVRYYDEYSKQSGLYIDIEQMERFYVNSFDEKVKNSCGFDEDASNVINYIKSQEIPMVVATNPFFPCVATYVRIRWAGLDPLDFAEITTYENYHYCKPNILYYEELFQRTGYDPKKCLMVGNNVDEDMIASKLGCDVFLILRNLINVKEADISEYPQGSLLDLKYFLIDKI